MNSDICERRKIDRKNNTHTRQSQDTRNYMVRQFTYVYGVAVIYYFQVQIQDRVVQCFCLSNDTNQTLI